MVRPFTPGPDVYTYWDYTQLRFPKRQGMRIDFILASPALAARVTEAQIVRAERKDKAPSDHAPVLVDLRRELNQPARITLCPGFMRQKSRQLLPLYAGLQRGRLFACSVFLRTISLQLLTLCSAGIHP